MIKEGETSTRGIRSKDERRLTWTRVEDRTLDPKTQRGSGSDHEVETRRSEVIQ